MREGILRMVFSADLQQKIEIKVKKARNLGKRSSTVEEPELERRRHEFAKKLSIECNETIAALSKSKSA